MRRHLLEGVPVSDLCDELGIHATQYYNWQKQLFENAAPAFERRPNKANQRRQRCRGAEGRRNWKPSCRRRTRSWRNCWRSTSS